MHMNLESDMFVIPESRYQYYYTIYGSAYTYSDVCMYMYNTCCCCTEDCCW